jgi:hypothetical protein
LTDLTFHDTQTGYACGPLGRTYKTLDGGTSWHEQPAATNRTLYAMRFSGPSTVIAVGADYVVLEDAGVTAVSPPSSHHPGDIELYQNWPNPFNPTTTISYSLPHRSHVTLTVFNMLGQPVTTLASGEQGPGYHELQFDASNLASGIYLYRLMVRPLDASSQLSGIKTGDLVQTRKLLLMR